MSALILNTDALNNKQNQVSQQNTSVKIIRYNKNGGAALETKLKQIINPYTEYEYIYVYGGHGDVNYFSNPTLFNNLGMSNTKKIINLMKLKKIRAKRIVLDFCYSMAFLPYFNDILTPKGFFIGSFFAHIARIDDQLFNLLAQQQAQDIIKKAMLNTIKSGIGGPFVATTFSLYSKEFKRIYVSQSELVELTQQEKGDYRSGVDLISKMKKNQQLINKIIPCADLTELANKMSGSFSREIDPVFVSDLIKLTESVTGSKSWFMKKSGKKGTAFANIIKELNKHKNLQLIDKKGKILESVKLKKILYSITSTALAVRGTLANITTVSQTKSGKHLLQLLNKCTQPYNQLRNSIINYSAHLYVYEVSDAKTKISYATLKKFCQFTEKTSLRELRLSIYSKTNKFSLD